MTPATWYEVLHSDLTTYPLASKSSAVMMKYTKLPFVAAHLQLSRKVVKVQSAKIQDLQIIINKEHDRGLVAYRILA